MAFYGIEDYEKAETKIYWSRLSFNETEVGYKICKSMDQVHAYRFSARIKRKARIFFNRHLRRLLNANI